MISGIIQSENFSIWDPGVLFQASCISSPGNSLHTSHVMGRQIALCPLRTIHQEGSLHELFPSLTMCWEGFKAPADTLNNLSYQLGPQALSLDLQTQVAHVLLTRMSGSNYLGLEIWREPLILVSKKLDDRLGRLMFFYLAGFFINLPGTVESWSPMGAVRVSWLEGRPHFRR